MALLKRFVTNDEHFNYDKYRKEIYKNTILNYLYDGYDSTYLRKKDVLYPQFDLPKIPLEKLKAMKLSEIKFDEEESKCRKLTKK